MSPHFYTNNDMKNLSSAFFAIFVTTILFSGCHTSHLRVFKVYPATDKDNVAIYYSEPEKPYEILAENEYYNAGKNVVKKWAASLGADAVIVVVSRTHSSSGHDLSVSGPEPEKLKLSQGLTEKQAFVTAIKYK
jgi:hypothetical protein